MAVAPRRDLSGVPSRSISCWSTSRCSLASYPPSSGPMTSRTPSTALVTPLPPYRFPPSRSSTASKAPVEAPLGTAARAIVPSSRATSTSTVGFPRESRISRAPTASMLGTGAAYPARRPRRARQLHRHRYFLRRWTSMSTPAAPRPHRRGAAPLLLRYLPLITVSVVLVAVLAVRLSAAREPLAAATATATARVVDSGQAPGGRGVSVTCEYGGAGRRAGVLVARDPVDLPPGEQVPVQYDPASPAEDTAVYVDGDAAHQAVVDVLF